MKGIVIYNEQEQSGSYIWGGVPACMTANFKAIFGDEAELIASTALGLIIKNHPCDADYFQTFKYVWPDGKETKFWLINDEDHWTALLPSDY